MSSSLVPANPVKKRNLNCGKNTDRETNTCCRALRPMRKWRDTESSYQRTHVKYARLRDVKGDARDDKSYVRGKVARKALVGKDRGSQLSFRSELYCAVGVQALLGTQDQVCKPSKLNIGMKTPVGHGRMDWVGV
ncbi:hypothetical protein EDD22DRAFT_852318 [Suillus occidentalis]|nr:hypothetical protein EDD22DRAFT_852318 [Suillus occidentalis]